jgi:hypothetical protein
MFNTKLFYSLKAELSEIREKSTIMGGRYRHNQLLEDLRHHQEQLAQEKKQWAQEKENLDIEMKTKKEELAKYQVIANTFRCYPTLSSFATCVTRDLNVATDNYFSELDFQW